MNLVLQNLMGQLIASSWSFVTGDFYLFLNLDYNCFSPTHILRLKTNIQRCWCRICFYLITIFTVLRPNRSCFPWWSSRCCNWLDHFCLYIDRVWTRVNDITMDKVDKRVLVRGRLHTSRGAGNFPFQLNCCKTYFPIKEEMWHDVA